MAAMSTDGGQEPVADTEREGYKIAKALVEAARPAAQARFGSYEKDIKYWLGEDHWPSKSGAAAQADAWKCKSVRNYLFATVDHKAAVVLDATPRLRAEPLDESSTVQQREVASNAVRHELERCQWDDAREDMFITASVAAVGIVMLRMETDKLSGEKKLALDAVDPRRLYPDPACTRPYKGQHMQYEPELDLSQIRVICEEFGCPEKFDKIKPKKSQPIGTATSSDRRVRGEEELLKTTGSEFAVDEKSEIRARKANVLYTWIKDDALSTEIKKVLMDGGQEGMVCLDCGYIFDPVDAELDEMTGMTGCPECASPNLSLEHEVTERKYPFGRLIVTCQEQELYDGPNPDEIDGVFPMGLYEHYRVPTRYGGFSDLALLKSNQQQADKNMAQLIDAMRFTGMGYLEYPAGELGYQHATNEPGTKIPVRPENSNKAHWVVPQGYNAQLHSIADNTIFSDFQRISGDPDTAVSQMPSAPDSATEVRSRDSVRQSRLGRHMKKFNKTWGDIASLAWQMMVQHYVGPRPFMFSENGSQFESVVLDVSLLPRNLRIRVEADIDGIETDKLAGQNLLMAMQSGMLPPMPDVFLRALGTPESVISEVMNRPEVIMHRQMMALAAVAGQGSNPNGNSPAPPAGAGPPPQASQNNEGVN